MFLCLTKENRLRRRLDEGRIRIESMIIGDVLLFSGGERLVDELVGFETHSKYTHAALAINESEFIEAWWEGVRNSNIEDYKKINEGYKDITVFTPIIPLSQSQQAKIVGYALGKIGQPFNYLQLLGFIIEKVACLKYNPFGSKHKTVCSQLVVQAYKQQFDIDLLPNIEDYSVAPSDLATSKLLQQERNYCH